MTDEQLRALERKALDNLERGPPSDFGPKDVLLLLHYLRCARRDLRNLQHALNVAGR
jgi:hypothetical protein